MGDTDYSTVKCPQCGFENPVGFKFCGNCGASLVHLDKEKTQTAIQATPQELREKMQVESHKIKGERRRVVVMFADISGFTDLSRQKDPEELKKLVDGAFLRLTEVVYQYEGYIDKVIGDSLMVLFGAPIAHEDDSERAVLCAFRLLETITEYSRQKQVDLNLSIGIARGLCYAGEYGKPGDYTVIGKDVNLAERLEKLAPPGEIYVSQGVYGLTRNRIEYERIGELELKGIGLEDVHKALGAELLQKEPMLFVGRRRELARLERMYEKAKEGEGGFCFVTGERGIGKSRLYQKFRLDRLYSVDVFLGQARGIGYLKNEFYFVLRETLRSILNIDERGSPDEVASGLESFFKTRTELRYASPFVKYLLSAAMSEEERAAVEGVGPREREKNIEGVISSFLLRLSCEKPLVIVVEDAQRIDSGSAKFFKNFQPLIKHQSILVILLCWEPLEGFYKTTPELKLRTLSQKDTWELLRVHFQGRWISSKLLATVLKMTKGHPLFIEEIIEIFKQEDLLVMGRSVGLVTDKIEVPDKVYNIVLARIDRLADPAKEVLKHASVIGFEFTDRLLGKMGEERGLNDYISTLEERDFIRYLSQMLEQIRVYSFKNEIIRDVAYELILKEERKELHRKLAEVVERLYHESINEHLDIIAYHYLEAEDPRAAEYLFRSGIRKLKGYRLDEALVDFERYLNIKEDAEVYLGIADTYYEKAEFDKALEYCDKAERLPADDDIKGRIKAAKGLIYLKKGRYEEAESHMVESVELIKKDVRAKADSYGNLGNIYMEQGSYEKARECFFQALKIREAEFGPKDPSLGVSFRSLGSLDYFTGKYDSALEYFQKTLDIFRERFGESHPQVAAAYNNIGAVIGKKGNIAEAFGYFKKGLDIRIAVFGKTHPLVAMSYNNLGVTALQMYDFASAERYVKKSLGVWLDLVGEIHPETAINLNNLSQIYWHQGNYSYTLKHLERALAVWNALGVSHPSRAQCYGNIGDVHLLEGEYDKALEYYEKGFKMNVDMYGAHHSEVARSKYRLAEVSFRKGRYEEALRYGQDAYNMYQKIMGDSHPIPNLSLALLGYIYGALGELDESCKINEQVSKAFTENLHKNLDLGFLLVPYLIKNEEFDRVEKVLMRALEFYEKTRNEKGLVTTYLKRSVLEQAKGNQEAASDNAEKGLRTAHELGLKPLLIDALLAASMTSNDRSYLDRALALAREIGDKPRQEEALQLLNK